MPSSYRMTNFKYTRDVTDSEIVYSLSGTPSVDDIALVSDLVERDLIQSTVPVTLNISKLDQTTGQRVIHAWREALLALIHKYGRIELDYLPASDDADDQSRYSLDIDIESVKADNCFAIDFDIDLSINHSVSPGSATDDYGVRETRPPPMFSKASAAERLERFCTIRYFRQMYPFCHYPMVVTFSDEKLTPM